jgi:hypothetical protein
MLPTLFDACQPRQDVLLGAIQEADFAADLAQVLRNEGPLDYRDPQRFFSNTYPTRGLKSLLRNVCLRLSESPDQVGALFRLDTQFGGGKTHGLIALAHTVRSGKAIKGLDEFVDPAAIPSVVVRVAAFDGENADPANGRRLSDTVRAHTPWGELAFALAGEAGYRLVERSDQSGQAPGADTLRELFGAEPCLILLDELAIYLRKVATGAQATFAAEQLTAFLTALFKAVESTPRAALVFTLALGKDGKSTDAYSQESQTVASFMAEAASVSARKAALLDPTEEDETVKVLCRRLFATIDAEKAKLIVAAYRQLWDDHRESLPKSSLHDYREEEFLAGYPLHPELIATLTNKTSTLGNFQRVRGMLRLLARTVAQVWANRPVDAFAIQLQHIDPGHEPIRQEIVTRLDQRQLTPAIKAEVAAHAGETPALAQDLDARHYAGLPPYGSYVARCILFHTLAYQDSLRGVTPEELRYAVLSPGTDLSFIDDARKRFIADSAYLDDRPNVPLRFLAEANLTQMIRRQEMQVDVAEARAQLNDRIRSIFGGQNLNLVPFAAGPHDVPDDAGEGHPYLVLVNYDAATISPDALSIPELIERTYLHKGSGTDWRRNRNNLLFLIADAGGVAAMKNRMTRRLALEALRAPDKQRDLAEYQVAKLGEYHERSAQELALSIQQTYRHIFYPSRNRIEGASVDLAHTAVDVQTASDRPGDGQKQVITQLQNVGKLRLTGDAPDSPAYIRDRTPLKKGQITVADLRNEFRLDPSLPILVADDVFLRGIRLGIDQAEYIYKSGDLLMGKGDPYAEIRVDEQSLLYTMAYAREHAIWPRPAPKPEPPGQPPPGGGPGSGPYPPPTPEPPPGVREPETFRAEDALRAALVAVVEKAQRAKARGFVRLTVRPFEPGDTLRLLNAMNTIANATKKVTLDISFEAADGSTTEVRFEGSPTEAMPLKDFIEPQLRAAADKQITANYTIDFNPALSLEGDAATKLVERLTRFATGAAEVVAFAGEK